MKKLFLNLNIFSLLGISNIALVACDNNVKAHNNTTNSSYDMGETKDFDLKSFKATDFQRLADDKIGEKKYSSSFLENQIKNKVLDTIFEQITNSRKAVSNELKALKEISWQIISFKFELINKNQQLRTTIEINKWDYIERFFKFTVFPNPNHRLIQGLAQLGLNNVKKYYDHIKNNKVEFTIEYGDKSFYSSIEIAKKLLEEDNKNNIDDYQFYVNLNPLHVKGYIKTQLDSRLQQLLKTQSTVETYVVDYKDRNTSNLKLPNDLIDKAIDANRVNLEYDQQYQTVIGLTDKNGYSEYVPIKFQLKDINLLIEKIQKLDFTQLILQQNQVSLLKFEVEKHIRESIKETKSMQIIVDVLNEHSSNKLEDKEYNLKLNIQGMDFQINWKINLFTDFNDAVSKIEQNWILPSNFYSKINNESELTYKINQDLKPFYDDNKLSVYVSSQLLKDENNEKEYYKYRDDNFSWSANLLAEFDSKKILAPVKYLIKVSVSSKNVSWLSKVLEKTILITEKA